MTFQFIYYIIISDWPEYHRGQYTSDIRLFNYEHRPLSFEVGLLIWTEETTYIC